MIAPKEQWGLGMGASGLTIKMVLFNITCVNVQLYFNSKYLKFSFKRYLGHQIVSVVSLLTFAAVFTFMVDRKLGLYDKTVYSFLLAGVLYTLAVIAFPYYLPVVFGLKKQDIQTIVNRIRNRGIGT